jgi:transcription factor E
MKITKEQLIDLISVTLGDDVLPLVHLLWKKSNISEFKLAEKLNITVNQTRNMLYRLSELNLVSFMRKKDKRKGWYIYYWSLKKDSAFNAVWRFKKKRLEQFKTRLTQEQKGVYYVCPNKCMRMGMDKAMEFDFRCQECGSLLGQQDNKRTVENILAMIGDMEVELEEFENQVMTARAARRAKETLKEKRVEAKKKKVEEKKRAERKAAQAEKRREAAKLKKALKEAKKKVKKKVKKKSAKKKAKKKKVKKKAKKKVIKKKVSKKKVAKKLVKKKKTKKKAKKK